jgi:hypothetical protein
VGLGLLRCADVSGRAGFEGGAGSAPGPPVLSSATDVRGQPILVLVQDAQRLGSIRSHPVALKLPIQKATVRWLLAWRQGTPAPHRARCHTELPAGQRGRAAAGVRPWSDFMMSYGAPGSEGTRLMDISRRKNVMQRKGHYPAFGRSRVPELDVVAQLRRRLELAGLAVHPSCAREETEAGRACVPPPAVNSAEG